MFTIIYYSPTGNTRYLAEYLGMSLKEKSVEILPLEFTNPTTLGKK